MERFNASYAFDLRGRNGKDAEYFFPDASSDLVTYQRTNDATHAIPHLRTHQGTHAQTHWSLGLARPYTISGLPTFLFTYHTETYAADECTDVSHY